MGQEENNQKQFCQKDLRRAIRYLIAVGVFLPIGMVVLFVFGRFFAFFNDPFSAAVFDIIALAFGLFWFVAIIALLFCVAWLSLERSRD